MQYPRMIYKTREDYLIVQNEAEFKALDGYKLHWEDKEAYKFEKVKADHDKPVETKAKRVLKKKFRGK